MFAGQSQKEAVSKQTRMRRRHRTSQEALAKAQDPPKRSSQEALVQAQDPPTRSSQEALAQAQDLPESTSQEAQAQEMVQATREEPDTSSNKADQKGAIYEALRRPTSFELLQAG